MDVERVPAPPSLTGLAYFFQQRENCERRLSSFSPVSWQLFVPPDGTQGTHSSGAPSIFCLKQFRQSEDVSIPPNTTVGTSSGSLSL